MGHLLRALRAAVFAAVCVLPAALGHALMSGSAVPWWMVAAGLAGTGAAAWCLSGRERGPLRVTGAAVGAQAVLHTGFAFAQSVAAGAGAPSARVWLATSCGSPVPDHVPGQVGHVHQHMAQAGMPDPGAATAMPGMAHGHSAVGMWAAHLLVALLCGLWLSGGERAAYRLGRTLAVRLFAPALLLLARVPLPAGPARVRADRHRTGQRLRRLLLAHVIATRGPPPRIAVG
ncbi:hypothetical protein E4099_19010 [Streptomyces palmae]|uniref:PE-PGRS family protein n=2 Tax=Streptomyces palmae TaxID=1701085 RepID=A0A4Z0H7M2_9ACTN|nr:hypothetical protein E4099_19010 [Streptomyces palmae]